MKSWAVVVHAFNPNTREAKGGSFKFEASLVYRVSSRTAKATQKNAEKLETERERERERERESEHRRAERWGGGRHRENIMKWHIVRRS